MKYKAIFTDIDGTLAPVGKNKPSKRVENALKQVESKGIYVVLVTGRSLSVIEDFSYIGDKYVIFDNGAGIYDVPKKSVIWESTLTTEISNEVLRFIRKFNAPLIGIATTSGRLKNPQEIPLGIKVRKIRLDGVSASNADSIIKKIHEAFPKLSVTSASSGEGEDISNIYLTAADATKQHAILQLTKIMNILPEEIIGIGDHNNDYPLLMACGLKVAMGNAVDDLKAIADYIAPSVYEDGVADVIEKFILGHYL